MSMKWRMAISYAVMFLVPLIIGLAGLIGIMIALIGRLPIFDEAITKAPNPLVALWDEQVRAYATIDEMINKHPNDLLRAQNMKEWEMSVADWNVGVIVWQGNRLVHQSPSLSRINALDLAKQFDAEQNLGTNDEANEDALPHTRGLILKTWDVHYMDQSGGRVWIVSDIGIFGRFVRESFRWFMFGLIAVFLMTMGLLTWWVSHSVVKPLRELTNATERIRAGDLAFEFGLKRTDEIGILANSFNQMRSQLKDAADVQQHYENNRKELLANISHDLRTPVTAIRGYAEAMVDGLTQNEEMDRRYAQNIVNKTHHVQHLIQELFELSLLDLGRKQFSFEAVDLVGFLKDCVDEMADDFQSKGIRLFFERTEHVRPIILVRADRAELQRVVMNVLDNAVKYMKRAEGEIVIRLLGESKLAFIHVEDNGSGIPPELLPNVFERFTRGDSSRSDGGAGLGLAIARQIALAHGGVIEAKSSPNGGTLISLGLPIWNEQGMEGGHV